MLKPSYCQGQLAISPQTVVPGASSSFGAAGSTPCGSGAGGVTVPPSGGDAGLLGAVAVAGEGLGAVAVAGAAVAATCEEEMALAAAITNSSRTCPV